MTTWQTAVNGLPYAPDYERDERGWILFPRDVEQRKALLPDDETRERVFAHPAKMQFFLAEEAILTYTGGEEAVILDPFGGTGTTFLATHGNAKEVHLIELEDVFFPILEAIQKHDNSDTLILHRGDSKVVMRTFDDNFFDLVLTSPPYANLQVGKVKTEFTGQLAKVKAEAMQYGSADAHPANFGRLNTFLFNQTMNQIYKEIKRVLKPGGFYVSVTKDQMRAGKRQLLGPEVTRIVQAQGLKYTGDWWKWKAPGGMLQSVMKSKGAEVVEDEDIIVFRKEN
jgi:DNA modification methylase